MTRIPAAPTTSTPDPGPDPLLRLVVALDCEARPLIDRYRLKRDRDVTGFVVYRDGGDTGAGPPATALIVSGPGKAAAAAAAGYLQARCGDRPGRAGWLNVGVAGHRAHAPGLCCIGNQVGDADTGQRWYPPLVIGGARSASGGPPEAAVMTVSRPETDYPEDVLYDMEAAGFYPVVCRFVSAELAQVVKIVSDNRRTPAARLSAAAVTELVAAAVDTIVGVAEQTRSLAATWAGVVEEPPFYRDCLARFHYTDSGRHRLREALRRWQTLYPQRAVPLDRFADAAALRDWLRRRLGDAEAGE